MSAAASDGCSAGRDAGLTATAERMLALFRLAACRRHCAAGSLSYGQQKLLDTAMAFMAGPRLVLLDEPAGGVNLTHARRACATGCGR